MALALPPGSGLDPLARQEWARSGAPGMAYAVIDEAGLHAGAYGERRAGSGQPVTADTPFALGSISKSFTAVAILQRVEAGQVELDAPVSAYLPAFEDGPGRAITLRQLLGHTSGYSTRQGNTPAEGDGDAEDALARQVARIATWQPSDEPGRRWAYSNANYLVLGRVIEAVSGRSYGDYVEAEILAPLGMRNSRVADGGALPAMATPHVPWFGGRRALPDQHPERMNAPAGGVIASAADGARYLAMLMNGQDDLITAEHKALMMRPASDASPFYGLGWSLDDANGLVSHTGLTPGVETLAMLRPEKGRAAIVLVNASGGLGFGETIRLRYAVALAGLDVPFEPDGGVWGRKALTLTFWLLPFLFLLGIGIAWFQRDRLRAKSGVAGAFRARQETSRATEGDDARAPSQRARRARGRRTRRCVDEGAEDESGSVRVQRRPNRRVVACRVLSLWLPLVVSLALVWVCLSLMPALFGVSLGTLALYQPDWVIGLWATAITGVAWAVFRLAVYHARG